MKKRGLVFFSACMLLLSTMSYAKPVDKKTAFKVLEQFSRIEFAGKSNAPQVTSMTSYKEIKSNDVVLMHIFYSENGFAIVSADDRVLPILGYSNEGTYTSESKNPTFAWWINGYKQQVEEAVKSKAPRSNEVAEAWERYLNPSTSPSKSTNEQVLPMLSTNWDQGAGYNDSCPSHPAALEANKRCYTGCVATAMAQVMRFYKYPAQGVGSHTYNHPAFGALSANFGATTYDWNAMTLTANTPASIAVISQLMFHCGVSVDMGYTPFSSGTQTTYTIDALFNYFKYRRFLDAKYKSQMTDLEWHDLLKFNLKSGYPMLYSGHDASSQNLGGHAWVCDGFNDASGNYYHMNWGWGGSFNGNFLVTALAPGGSTGQQQGDFINGQYLITNIVPDTDQYPLCNGTKTYKASFGTIEDGSGSWNYKDNTDCRWLIAPDSCNYIKLSFSYFDTETDNDVLTIYDGESTSSPVLRTMSGNLSGTNFPTPIFSTSGKMLLVFKSNGSVVKNGWKVSWARQYTGINEEENSPIFNMYPNPTNDKVTVEFASQSDATREVVVLDPSGRVVRAETPSMNSDKIEVSLGGLTSGIYFIQVKEGSAISVKKIMKM